MTQWRLDGLNSLATRIAVTMVLAVLLSVALTIALVIGYALERQRSPDGNRDFRVFVDRFGVLMLNRHLNLPMISSRLATAAQAVGRAAPADRPLVMAAIADQAFQIEIRDAPTLQTGETDVRLDRLRRLIEFQLKSAADDVRVAVRGQDAPRSGTTPGGLLVEVKLPDGKWLTATLSDFRLENGNPGLWFLLLTPLILPVVAMSVWTVRRLVRPISAFAVAAERFGMGVEAIPLDERGPQEVRTAIRAFNRMQERLRRFIDDRTLMVAAMSHDLKTPLTRLRLRAEFVGNADQQRKMLADIEDMTAMIESTLTFVRDDAKREPPLLVDLGALTESVCENAMDTGARVEVTARQGVHVICRPVATSRAVANLIDNAIKYGGCARVTLGCDVGRAVLTVDDDGPGIPEREREKVFAPFYRLEGSRNRDTGGVGLGLAVARTTAREHGGDVTLDAAESGGLRVRLELPISPVSRLPAEAPSAPKPAGVSACA
jgi:signal transduction histidine kinase